MRGKLIKALWGGEREPEKLKEKKEIIVVTRDSKIKSESERGKVNAY